MSSKAKDKVDAVLAAAKEPEVADHQHEWEAGILATLAKHGGDESEFKWLILSRLDPDDLTRPDHRTVYSAMKALHDAGEGVDSSLVKERIAREGHKVADADVDRIFDAPPIDNLKVVETHLKRIVERARFASASALLRKVQAELDIAREEGDPAAVDAAIAKVQSVAFDLTASKRIVAEVKSEADLLDEFVEDLRGRISEKGFVGMDTGFQHLNNVINGLCPGLVILGGPPGSGKTTFVKQLADRVAELNKVPVLFFSFEMAATELRIKTLSRLSKVNSRDILKGKALMQGVRSSLNGPSVPEWDLVEQAARDYAAFAGHIRIIEAGLETTVDRIRLQAMAAKHRARAGRVLVVVDYLQIIPVNKPKDFQTTKDKVDFLCSELRRLARDLDSPVVALSSLNRDAYRDGGRPTLAAFKESGGVEFTADVAGAFWTDNKPKEERLDHRPVSLFVLKNRHGELSEIVTKYFPATHRFDVIDKKDFDYMDSLKDANK